MRIHRSTSGGLGLAVLCLAGLGAGPVDLETGFRDPPAEARPSTYWLWLNGYVNRAHVGPELKALRDAGFRGLCLFDMGAVGAPSTVPPAGPEFLGDQSVADVAHAVGVAGRLGLSVQLSVASSWDMGATWVEPRHASMGLYTMSVEVEGPAAVDRVLPTPEAPPRAPRDAAGKPAFSREIAVLAVPAGNRKPGHDFVFALDPPGLHTLSHAVLTNTVDHAARDISLSISTTVPDDASFREVFRGALAATAAPQRFELPKVPARYARLRVLNGHEARSDRVQLAEFELFDDQGVNVVASHEAARDRSGALLLGPTAALGQDGAWTAANVHDGVRSGPGGCWASAGPPPLLVDDPAAVLDLSGRLGPDGRLRWDAPPGRWLVVRYVCLNTGERLKLPSPASDGLATDHFNAEATREYINHVIVRLRSGLGDDLRASALSHLYLASYEVRGPVWTPDFLDQFRRYRGYDMKPYLPVLSGHVVGGDPASRRFLDDYRKTQGQLLTDAYYRTAVSTAHAAGLKVESEAGGPGPPVHQVPVDALEAQGALDDVRGEFWPRRPDSDALWVVKETACAAHIYGKNRVHMESFTSTHHWQDGPSDLKPSADRALCEGANHFVWHTSAHQPPEAGQPGWVYNAGTHLTRNDIWWPHAPAFLDYLARASFLLQQGRSVADVCYYHGDHGYNFVPPKHVDPSLGPGFDYDVIDAQALRTRLSVRDGRLTVPDGPSYALLVLPDLDDFDLDALQRVDELARAGATVVGRRPRRSSGLADAARRDEQVRALAARLWGPIDGRTVTEHAVGAGRVVDGRSLREILATRGIVPDARFETEAGAGCDDALDFIHRAAGAADVYFVRNRLDRWTHVVGTFRDGRGRRAELWDPVSGRIASAFESGPGQGGVAVPLRLAPNGSIFVVFRGPVVGLSPIFVQAEPPAAADLDAVPPARVVSWDGRRVRLAVTRPGTYRAQTADGRAASLAVDSPPPMLLEGPWEVRFPDGRGAPPSARFDRLVSWTEHPDAGIRYHAGRGVYRLEFDLPGAWLGTGRRVRLDLGRLWSTAAVSLNGQRLGTVWTPPYTVDLTPAARPGRNALEVELAGSWSNRLVGDALSPGRPPVSRTNVSRNDGVPWKDVPLIPTGLFGPVRVVPEVEVEVPLL